MNADPTWSAVDDYLDGLLAPVDDALAGALAASEAAGLPDISVTATQGKLLMLLAQLVGARRVLEIGTLGGYSTIWLARGVSPGGHVTTLELRPEYAAVATANLAAAGLSDVVDVRVGAAAETLPLLADEGAGPYDLVFIDADKRSNPTYVEWALALTRPGAVIVVDNVARQGRIVDETSDDPDVQGVRAVLTMMATDPRLSATALQTVGAKGYDGFALALVLAPASPALPVAAAR